MRDKHLCPPEHMQHLIWVSHIRICLLLLFVLRLTWMGLKEQTASPMTQRPSGGGAFSNSLLKLPVFR